MQEIEVPWLLPALYWIVGIAFGYAAHVIASRVTKTSIERQAEEIQERAKHEAEVIVREAKVKAHEEIQRVREKVESDLHQHRREVAAFEVRISDRETQVNQRTTALNQKELQLDLKRQEIETAEASLRQQRQEVEGLQRTQREKLQEISRLSTEEARSLLLKQVGSELEGETAALVRKRVDEAAATATQQARRIITVAIERFASERISDATTTTVVLPSEEMKGRIIGREGRNIRSLEAALGVNVIIDDTPAVVVLSSFDPVRREVAKRTLEQLVVDGRIHPARIEEMVGKVQAEMDTETQKAGEAAAAKLELRGIAPEVLNVVGRLRFRHSYGQNVLEHSIEMAQIMGMMASEIGIDPIIAKRCGLLHDIGKALPQDAGGSHALAGADYLRRHGESPVVCNAVAAHHNEAPGESWYAELTRAGDAITASRPGARSETTEIYLKRLEKLEELARSFPGVTKCFAVEAGREIRVMVEPARVDDNHALLIARDLSRLIEHNLEYPGHIKVVVIRETRSTEYAR